MSGLVFDLVNAVVAFLALVIATITAYKQLHRVDGLSISFLSFGLINQTVQDKHRYADLTFAFANTGSTAIIVSAMYITFALSDGSTRLSPGLARGRAVRMEPLLIATGSLVHGQVSFEADVDAQVTRVEHNRIPLTLHVELVDGKGVYRAREIDGFYFVEGTQGSLATGCPLGKNAVVLPKPATDKAKPFGI
jgi:hypothetical protein